MLKKRLDPNDAKCLEVKFKLMLKKGLDRKDAKCLEVKFKLMLKKGLDPNDAKCLEVKFELMLKKGISNLVQRIKSSWHRKGNGIKRLNGNREVHKTQN